MKIKNAFSLAEALITLLIVCVIAIASAPVLTRQQRDFKANKLWKRELPSIKDYILPTERADVLYGKRTGMDSCQGIRIETDSKVSFKNKTGKEVGFVDDKGNSSFGVPAGMIMYYAYTGGNGSQCPTGWKALTGSNFYVTTQHGKVAVPVLAGAFIRTYSTNNYYYTGKLGERQKSALKVHSHPYYSFYGAAGAGAMMDSVGGKVYPTKNAWTKKKIETDGSSNYRVFGQYFTPDFSNKPYSNMDNLYGDDRVIYSDFNDFDSYARGSISKNEIAYSKNETRPENVPLVACVKCSSDMDCP